MSVLLAAAAAVLMGVGTYLVLQRQLSRIVIGVGLMGHGANVLFVLAAQGGGRPPFTGEGAEGPFTDPLPEAMALTGIVITFAVTAFLLALAYRSWMVTHDDEVEDSLEDRLIAREEADDRRAMGGPLSDSDPQGEGLADTDIAPGVAEGADAGRDDRPRRPG
jgi:multicomponent Na+:H+ antiporter subunit C